MRAPPAGSCRKSAAVLMLLFFIALNGVVVVLAEDLVPPRSSPERKAILDTLRKQLEGSGDSKLTLVFVVRHLKVKNGWTWVSTDPQSPDGSNMYEPVEALLHKSDGVWHLETMRPSWGECEDDPVCGDDARYYRAVREKFPDAPSSIFPAAE